MTWNVRHKPSHVANKYKEIIKICKWSKELPIQINFGARCSNGKNRLQPNLFSYDDFSLNYIVASCAQPLLRNIFIPFDIRYALLFPSKCCLIPSKPRNQHSFSTFIMPKFIWFCGIWSLRMLCVRQSFFSLVLKTSFDIHKQNC